MNNMHVVTKKKLEVYAEIELYNRLETLFLSHLGLENMDYVDIEDAIDWYDGMDDVDTEILAFLLAIKMHPEYMNVDWIGIV